MANFYELLEDALLEKGMTMKEFDAAGVVPARSCYQYKNFTPYLDTVIKIANYLEVSLDFLAYRTTKNTFRRYSTLQTHFYEKLIKTLKDYGVSQSELCRETNLSRPLFTFWKKGNLPKFSTLITLADYFECSIDDFVDKESIN